MKRNRRSPDSLYPIVLCFLAVFLGRGQTVERSKGRLDIVSLTVQRGLGLISTPFRRVTNSASDFFSGLFNANRLVAENRLLKALAKSTELYAEQLERLNGEVERLRKLSAFGPLPGKHRLHADVIGYFPYENRITLNVGSRDGVVPNVPVEAVEGLVGTVQVVEGDRCQVLLLSSRELTIGALDISRVPPPAGLVRGDNSAVLNVTFENPQSPVEVGDTITSAGFSEHIPRGIKIGKVISVKVDEEFGLLRARIDPAVSIGSLREVHVLL